MNCEHCGAALAIDQLRQVRFCPYCGAEIEIKEETPETMAGTIHGIAKTFFNQTADKIRYNREHAAEIAEQKRKDIWDYLKEQRPGMYSRIRRNVLNIGTNIPSEVGRRLGLGGYHLAQKIFKFN